jgi:hypothetical protein
MTRAEAEDAYLKAVWLAAREEDMGRWCAKVRAAEIAREAWLEAVRLAREEAEG